MAESLGDKLKRIAAEKKAARELADKQASAAGGATPEVEVGTWEEVSKGAEVIAEDERKANELRELVTENSEASLEARFKLAAEAIANEQRSEGHEQPNELGTVCGNEQHEVSSGAVEGQQQTAVADDNQLAAGSGSEEFNNSVSASEIESTVSIAGSANTDSSESAGDTSKGTEIQSASMEPASSVGIAERTTSDHPLSMQFAEMEQALLAADPTFKTILRDVHRQLGNDPELVTMMTEDEIRTVVTGLLTHANADIIEPAKAKTVKKEVAAAKKKVIGADDL